MDQKIVAKDQNTFEVKLVEGNRSLPIVDTKRVNKRVAGDIVELAREIQNADVHVKNSKYKYWCWM